MAKTEILNHCHYDYEIARIQFMICDKFFNERKKRWIILQNEQWRVLLLPII